MVYGIFSILFALFVVGVIYFVSRRERREQLLKQEFITIITHKFRTPLTSIRWAIEMLRNDITFQMKDDLLKEMQQANERINEIIDLITDFSKIDAGLEYAYSYVSIRILLDKSLQKFAQSIRNKQMTFQIESGEELPILYIDGSKIQFVIDILLENAIKYSPNGSTIVIGFLFNRKFFEFYVRDSGIGMTKEEIRKLFTSFWRSEAARKIETEGMGLGLHTSKQIVDRHGGRIWAESEGPGKGSTFRVRLKIPSEAIVPTKT